MGITQIPAHSPQAKGRVERANGTFQDRLVAELRLAGASTLEEANQVLSDFLPRFNQRFGVPATQLESAYRAVHPEVDLGGVLCIKELRRAAKDNTVRYHGRTWQLYPSPEQPSYARARVEVQERLDGRILVRHPGKLLIPQEAPPLAARLRAQVAAGPVVVALSHPDPTDWGPPLRGRAPVIPGPLAGRGSGMRIPPGSRFIGTWCWLGWSGPSSRASASAGPGSGNGLNLSSGSPR